MNIFLKKWLSLINGSPHATTWISNHAMVWLIVFYLQINGILPSVNELLEKGYRSRDVGGIYK